jgi:hypothetical protein
MITATGTAMSMATATTMDAVTDKDTGIATDTTAVVKIHVDAQIDTHGG